MKFRIFSSDKFNIIIIIIEEVHKIIIDEGSRNAWFNRMIALSQHGYSPEKDPGLILVFFYQC